MNSSGNLNTPSTVPEAPLEEGYLLRSRYRIDAFLEVKSGANLYRAIDEVTHLTVIVKEKNRPQSRAHLSQKALRNPWYDEFTILRSISYPTVVKAVDMQRNQYQDHPKMSQY